MSCNGICKRFLAQLRRVRGHKGYCKSKSIWSGYRDQYDYSTYNLRVIRRLSPNSMFEYRKCWRCEIYVAYGFYDNTCPCCGNSRMVTNLEARETRSYGKARY